jgi:hypothetical protein
MQHGPACQHQMSGQVRQAPATPAPSTTVVVKDLQGADQKLVTPLAVPSSTRQLAQRANDRGLQLFKEKNTLRPKPSSPKL